MSAKHGLVMVVVFLPFSLPVNVGKSDCVYCLICLVKYLENFEKNDCKCTMKAKREDPAKWWEYFFFSALFIVRLNFKIPKMDICTCYIYLLAEVLMF